MGKPILNINYISDVSNIKDFPFSQIKTVHGFVFNKLTRHIINCTYSQIDSLSAGAYNCFVQVPLYQCIKVYVVYISSLQTVIRPFVLSLKKKLKKLKKR